MSGSARQVFVVRHGETEWSLEGRHTGITDIALTDNGRQAARRLQPLFAAESVALALCSPLQRARETCELSGLGPLAEVERDLLEWNYGEYEGLTPDQIHVGAPAWVIFRDGCPGGEDAEQVGRRVDRVIARARAANGNVAIFAHGHLLRVLAARWIGLPPECGVHFLLDTATFSILSDYHGVPAIKRWNPSVAG